MFDDVGHPAFVLGVVIYGIPTWAAWVKSYLQFYHSSESL